MEQLPNSVKVVLGALQGSRPLTGKDLQVMCGLPRRTIYTALVRLREEGILRERRSLRDTRQTYFWILDRATVGGAG